VHYVLSFSVSYPDLIKFPYFADTTERGDRGQSRGDRDVTDCDFRDNSCVCTKCLGKKTSSSNFPTYESNLHSIYGLRTVGSQTRDNTTRWLELPCTTVFFLRHVLGPYAAFDPNGIFWSGNVLTVDSPNGRPNYNWFWGGFFFPRCHCICNTRV
jgi:hypothetical protein